MALEKRRYSNGTWGRDAVRAPADGSEGECCPNYVPRIETRVHAGFEVEATVSLFAVVYPGIFSGGGSTNLVEDRGQRERGSRGGSLLVRGSGGSCNLVQEISFHIVKFS